MRPLVLLLLLANAAWFAWAQGYLRFWGLAPANPSEPHRLERQLRPEQLRIERPGAAGVGAGLQAVAAAPRAAVLAAAIPAPPPSAAPAAGQAPAGAVCLVSPPLDPATAARVQAQLASWPAQSWSLVPGVEPARWIVYMGRYADAGDLERKRAELRQRNVGFEPVANPALQPGLSLGSFGSDAEARQYLDALAGRGIRTASVVQERGEARGVVLRLAAVDESARPRMEPLRAALGKVPLRTCP